MAEMRFFRVVHYPTEKLIHEASLPKSSLLSTPYRIDPDRVVHAPDGLLVDPPWQIQGSYDEYEWVPLFTAKSRKGEGNE